MYVTQPTNKFGFLCQQTKWEVQRRENRTTEKEEENDEDEGEAAAAAEKNELVVKYLT